MVSHIPLYSPHYMVSSQHINPPCLFPVVLVINPPKRVQSLRLHRKQKKQSRLFFEFSSYFDCGFVRMCKRWEGEGEGEEDPTLELEVYEFMNNSKNPSKFPSKKELIEGGRMDLVEAILKRGGWMSMGWEKNEVEKENFDNGLVRNLEISIEKCSENGVQGEGRSGSVLNEENHLEGNCFPGDFSTAASSAGRSLETSGTSGIEGILKRLERQRNQSFGFILGKNGSHNHGTDDFSEDELRDKTSKNADSNHPGRSDQTSLHNDESIHHDKGSNTSYATVLGNSLTSDTWRTWSIQRAGLSDKEFEAAEIEFGKDKDRNTVDRTGGHIDSETADINEHLLKTKDYSSRVQEISQSDIKTRLQHLELELSSTLRLIRSNTAGVSEKAEHTTEDLTQLSDASEFQENELMSAQDNLRTMRAKLAVLEGKMALAIIDAQKILDEKQKRISDAYRALQLLRTICIVWPNSGSEVLLAGSYDGWATQRKMERSKNGFFSLWLKLYPGKYEIKFIVDGSWKVDPLRPIVNNSGFENNLLIID